MVSENIIQDFREKVSDQLRVVSEGIDRYHVFTPFLFDDGDHLVIVLKRLGDKWILTDEGHTYMHLTYDLDEKDLQRGTRQSIIANTLSVYNVNDRAGELLVEIPEDKFGDSLYSFIQALIKIADITYLSRERVSSTFMDDFETFLKQNVPEQRSFYEWHDPQKDPGGNYPVDCRINGMESPLFVYGVPNDGKARDVTINLLQYERWGLGFRSMAIFENQEEISRKVLARFSDVCEKQFSTLDSNKDRIAHFLQTVLAK
jgi:hypothetical protein